MPVRSGHTLPLLSHDSDARCLLLTLQKGAPQPQQGGASACWDPNLTPPLLDRGKGGVRLGEGGTVQKQREASSWKPRGGHCEAAGGSVWRSAESDVHEAVGTV